MAGSVAQAFEHVDAPSGTTSVVAATLTGNAIIGAATNDTGVAASVTAGDPTNGAASYTILDDVTDTGDGQRMITFIKTGSTASGSVNVTFTWSAAAVFKAGLVIDCTGVPGALDQHVSAYQPTPSLTTDLMSSGATPTLNTQPALLVGIGFNAAAGGVPGQGSTGWSAPVTGVATFWSFGGPLTLRVEWKRLTATTGVAAVFTASSNTGSITAAIVIDETAIAGLTAFADTSAPVRRPTRAPPPADPQPLKALVAPVVSPSGEANQPQWRVTKDPQPENPQVQPIKTQPFARNIDMNAPVRRPDRRTALEPQPQPLRSPVVPVLTALETTQTTQARRSIAPQPDEPQPLRSPVLPVLTALETTTATQARRVIAPQPAVPQPLAAPVVNPYGFPWTPHPSGRYFIDTNGNQRLINGITVWAAITMDATEQASLIASCVSNRVNLIEFGLIWRASTASDPRWSTRAPFANNGTLLPFTTKIGGGAWGGSTTDPDYTATNSVYFAFAKAFVDACAAAGIAVLMFPSYTGTSGGGGSTPDDGWANEMVANQIANTTNMVTYGTFVATTFVTCANIVWGMGGDAGTVNRPFTGSERDAVIGMVNGILSVGGQASQRQFGAEWGTGSIVDDQTDFLSGSSGPTLGSTGTWRTHYEFFGSIITLAARGFSTSPTKPCVVQELPFYREDAISGTGANPAATDPVRRWYAWAWTSGCTAGWNVGNGYVWPSNITANLPFRDLWQLHITADQNAAEMANMRTLAETLRWWLAQPSPSIITANAGSGDGSNTSGPGAGNTTTVTALTSTDGSFIVIYYPPDQTGAITVDTTSLSTNYRARYYDVTNNTYTTIGTAGFTHAPSSATVFAAPPTNSRSQADQFIVLDTPTSAVVVVEPADMRKQVARSPHLHQSAHALPGVQAPAISPVALVPEVVARQPRVVRWLAGQVALPSLILPWIGSDVALPQARGAGAARSAPTSDPTEPLLILPWIDVPPGPIQARSPRSELRAANSLTLPPPPFTPGGVDLPWASGRATRAPQPTYGDVAAPVVFTWSPEAALVAWRPTRAPGPVYGDVAAPVVFAWSPEAALVAWRPTRAPRPAYGDVATPLVFPWTPEAALAAWRATRAPAPTWGEALAALVFPWTPEPALVAAQRARRGDLRQLAGEPLPPLVVAAFTAWGFQPDHPRPRSPFADRRQVSGEPLPAVLVAAFTAWGFEPAAPGARRFRLDRSAAGEPLPQLILPAAVAYDLPVARALRPDRGGAGAAALPFLTLPPVVDQVVAAARARTRPVQWVTEASGAVTLGPVGGWSDTGAGGRVLLRPAIVSPDAVPPLVIPVSGFVYAETSAQRRRDKIWTTIERPAVFIPPPIFPWGYEAVSPVVRRGLRTGLPYLALVLGTAALPPAAPTFPLPPPFVVHLLDENGPVDLTGKTVVCRTQPADRTRSVRVAFAEVVDALRGLVRKTWTEQDLRGVPTGDMLLQFVVFDVAGRPRTYPGDGHYYHQEITGRTR